jgi:hypothetical protein
MAGSDRRILDKMVSHALTGKGAHAEAQGVFEGLDWKVAGARPEGVSHSLFQLLNHMNYWQDWVVKWLDGEKPPTPRHASGSWPGEPGPASPQEWVAAIQDFRRGLDELERRSRETELFGKQGN